MEYVPADGGAIKNAMAEFESALAEIEAFEEAFS